MLRTEIFKDIDCQNSTLSQIFGELEKDGGSLSFKSLANWWGNFGLLNSKRLGYNKEIIIIVLFNNNFARAILPLMEVTRFKKQKIKIRNLEFISQTFNGQILDLIHKGDISIEELNFLIKDIYKKLKFDYINLSYLPKDSLLLKIKLNKKDNKSFLHAGKVLIPITDTYDVIRSKTYSKNLRHILNKFNRRISESDSEISSVVIEGSDKIKQYKNEIIKVSLSKLAQEGKHSVYQNENQGNAYFNSIMQMEKPFCALYIENGIVLSYNMGYIENGVVYALDAAYNREYADSQKIGLGILAYDQLVSHFAQQSDFIDMGFGFDDYKFRFSKHIQFTHSLILKGNTFKSIIIEKKLYKNALRQEEFLKVIIQKYETTEIY
jgi:hypothetical protein